MFYSWEGVTVYASTIFENEGGMMLTLRERLNDSRHFRWERWELLILAHQFEGHGSDYACKVETFDQNGYNLDTRARDYTAKTEMRDLRLKRLKLSDLRLHKTAK